MDAKKCDRCGKYYLEYKTQDIMVCGTREGGEWEIKRYYKGSPTKFDFCEECMKELILWARYEFVFTKKE